MMVSKRLLERDLANALMEVRDGLRDGTYEASPDEWYATSIYPMGADIECEHPYFNMSNWLAKGSCGTAACIGGLCEMLLAPIYDDADLRKKVMRLMEQTNPGLQALFFMDDTDKHSLREVTPALAADAIDNYLKFGEPRWDEVFANAEGQGT